MKIKTLMPIGDYLKQARESKGIELLFISQKTRINFRVLQHLENNEINKLPNKTYVKGFVQTYARELKLDMDYALRCLSYTYGELQQVKEEEQKQDKPADKPQNIEEVGQASHHFTNPEDTVENLKEVGKMMTSTFRKKYLAKLLWFGLLIIVIGVIIWWATQWQAINQPTEKTETMVAQKETEAKIEAEPTPVATKKETATEEVAVEEKAEAIPETQTKTEGVKAQITQNIEKKVEDKEKDEEEKPLFPKINFYSMTGREFYTLSSDAKELNNPELYPTHVKNAMIPGKQNLFINAVDGSSWLRYKLDDKPIKSFTLRQGKVLLLRGNEILIFFGNVNALKIFYNNQLVNAPSRSGVKSLVFPPENQKEYMTPLFPNDKRGRAYTSKEYIQARKEWLEKQNN